MNFHLRVGRAELIMFPSRSSGEAVERLIDAAVDLGKSQRLRPGSVHVPRRVLGQAEPEQQVPHLGSGRPVQILERLRQFCLAD